MPQLKEKSKQVDATIADLHERLSALEGEMAALKARQSAPSSSRPYLQSFGAVPDDKVTRDAERLGRHYRAVAAQMLILDTDHISEYIRGSTAGQILRQRISETTDEAPLTIVTIEEVHRGWLAKISKARTPDARLEAYSHYLATVEALRMWPVLPWDARAETSLDFLVSKKLRLGTMDLRIASIVLAFNATLLSRNLRDFTKVPSLRVENWLG